MIEIVGDRGPFVVRSGPVALVWSADDRGRLVQLYFGDRAELIGRGGPMRAPAYVGDETSSWRDEGAPVVLPAFGDVVRCEAGLKAAFDHGGREVRDLRPRVRGARAEPRRPGLAPEARETVEALVVELVDELSGLRMEVCAAGLGETGVIEVWAELENRGAGPIALEFVRTVSLWRAGGPVCVTGLTGRWAGEFGRTTHAVSGGRTVFESRGMHTGLGANPAVFLHDPNAGETAGEVWAAALAYSGNWEASAERLEAGPVRLTMGESAFDAGRMLAMGERVRTPSAMITASGAGFGPASRRLHDAARRFVLPGPRNAPGDERPVRPVLYNSWEAVGFSVDAAQQLALARRAARIGVELFCLDDGWFRSRSSDRAGLGDWTPDPERFPGGVRPIGERARELGMSFGLWVEPEMISPDSDLARAYPDWALGFPGRERSTARNQWMLDLGREDVAAWVLETLTTVVERDGPDMLKWDFNRVATEPGSPAGRGIWRRHVDVLYETIDALRARFPGLAIETCSGGGGRIDLGVLQRTEQAWASDNTDALDRLRIQEGYSLAYPTASMAAWVTAEVNGMTGRRHPLDMRFAAACRGVLGIGTDLNSLPEEELERYAAWVSFYKGIRHVTQLGALHRLSRAEETGTDAWLQMGAGGGEAVWSAVSPGVLGAGGAGAPATVGALPALTWLDPDRVYGAWDRRGERVWERTGAELMVWGVPRERGGVGGGGFGEPASEVLHLRAEG